MTLQVSTDRKRCNEYKVLRIRKTDPQMVLSNGAVSPALYRIHGFAATHRGWASHGPNRMS